MKNLNRTNSVPVVLLKKILAFLIFSLVVHICGSPLAAAATAEEFQAAMARHLSCYPLQRVNHENQEISITEEDLCLAGIYTATGMKPLWVTENGPNEKGEAILQFLENAESEGLRPSDYNAAGIRALWLSQAPDDLTRLDTQLTLNLVKYVHDVSHGRIKPFKTDPRLFAEAGDLHFKPVQVVEQALVVPDLDRYLAGLPPSHEHYRKLREALQYYRGIAAGGGWQQVADGKTLRPGDADERIIQVRRRLAQTGEFETAAVNESFYDEQLISAVKKFQKKFGLETDGIIGRKTMAALNTTPGDIVNRIIVNMARWRWQEHDLGRRYIMVNIANYDLTGVEDGREVLEMAVIVGKLQNQTPVFSHRVQYVDFNPFWNVPPSIARNEELRELRKDPFYLVNRKVRLFSGWQEDAVELDSTAIDWQAVTPREMDRYKLRQDPGPWNALGPVKLVFPNEYNIYIHGTPAQELFAHNTRNFSHGCIRASDPLALAEFALAEEEPGWSLEDIREIVAQGEREVVKIANPLPVHITYQTVWIDRSGMINYSMDNYGRDRKLAEILFASPGNADAATQNLSVNE